MKLYGTWAVPKTGIGLVSMSLNTCYYHPNIPAVSVCTRCGRRTCGSCSKPYGGLTMCPNCFYTIPSHQPAAPPPIVSAYPAGPPPMGPPALYAPMFPHFVRWRWLPVTLVVIGAALIFANGVALLSPAFFFLWAGLLPWVGFLGSFGFILGIMLGLILLGAVVLMILRFRVMAAFVIFPTAIVSFFIGGGFVLGAILAVLGGILLIL